MKQQSLTITLQMFNQALQEQIAVEGQSIPLDSDSKMSIQMTMNHLVVSVIKKIAGRYTPVWWDCICKMGSMPTLDSS